VEKQNNKSKLQQKKQNSQQQSLKGVLLLPMVIVEKITGTRFVGMDGVPLKGVAYQKNIKD